LHIRHATSCKLIHGDLAEDYSNALHAESLADCNASLPIDDGGLDEDDTHSYMRIILGDIYLVNHHEFNSTRNSLGLAVYSIVCAD
jgi:hypothetical protein